MALLVCDTDFLIKIANDPLPAFRAYIDNADYDVGTIREVVSELEGLTLNERPFTARRASNALRLIGKSVHLIEQKILKDGNVDADIALYELARMYEDGLVVATLDGKLLSRFEKNNLTYLTLRHDKPFLRSLRRATYLSAQKQQF
jgi:rRNA-processing protein FCF1